MNFYAYPASPLLPSCSAFCAHYHLREQHTFRRHHHTSSRPRSHWWFVAIIAPNTHRIALALPLLIIRASRRHLTRDLPCIAILSCKGGTRLQLVRTCTACVHIMCCWRSALYCCSAFPQQHATPAGSPQTYRERFPSLWAVDRRHRPSRCAQRAGDRAQSRVPPMCARGACLDTTP